MLYSTLYDSNALKGVAEHKKCYCGYEKKAVPLQRI